MRLDLLANHLASQRVGIVGKTIFAHYMPAECKEGVLLKLPISGIEHDPYMPGYYKTTLQAIVRGQSETRGEKLSDQVVKALVHELTKDYFDQPGSKFAMRINYLLQEKLPIRYPRLDGNGIEWSLNFMSSFVLPTK